MWHLIIQCEQNIYFISASSKETLASGFLIGLDSIQSEHIQTLATNSPDILSNKPYLNQCCICFLKKYMYCFFHIKIVYTKTPFKCFEVISEQTTTTTITNQTNSLKSSQIIPSVIIDYWMAEMLTLVSAL